VGWRLKASVWPKKYKNSLVQVQVADVVFRCVRGPESFVFNSQSSTDAARLEHCSQCYRYTVSQLL
jgi:hypothetical protein